MKRITRLLTLCVATTSLLIGESGDIVAASETQNNKQVVQNEFRTEQKAKPIIWNKLKKVDYSFSDIQGKEYNIKQLLDSGKRVLIVGINLWTSECWDVHEQHILGEFNKKYSDELQIIIVDIDGDAPDKIMNSNNDWTDGGKYPFPIVSSTQLMDDLGLKYKNMPFFMLIDFGGNYFDATQKIWKDEISSENILKAFSEVMDSALKPDDIPEINDIRFGGYRKNTPINLKAYVRSADYSVNYIWNIEGSSQDSYNEESPNVTWKEAGIYKVTLHVKDKNGEAVFRRNIVINDDDKIAFFPYLRDFESPLNGWTSIDKDKDGYDWILFNTVMSKATYFWQDNVARSYVHSGVECMSSWSYYPMKYNEKTYDYDGKNLNTDNWLITPQIKLPTDGFPVLDFYIKSYGSEGVDPNTGKDYSFKDSFALWVSTGSNKATEDFKDNVIPLTLVKTNEYKGIAWYAYSIDLSKYKGQSIYIAWQHKSKSKYGLLLDDIKLSISDKPLSNNVIDGLKNIQITIDGDTVNVMDEDISSLEIFDIQGKIMTMENKNTCSIHLNPGIYIVRVKTSHGQYISKKIIVK
ncbi:choice-of-anchor J domain-containing protein [Falsiporphyromonas endometrii]|uniref:Choice-of-anchor J domain-containing protein n=1 Tax=Falsiporphyromonas endometrii TaxID=1387297 RepID=A0ABV9K890_9PORP